MYPGLAAAGYKRRSFFLLLWGHLVPPIAHSLSRKRKVLVRQCKHSPNASGHFDELMPVACRVGRVGVRDELEETCYNLSRQPHNSLLGNTRRQGDFSTIFNEHKDQFVKGLPLLGIRLESHFYQRPSVSNIQQNRLCTLLQCFHGGTR